MRFITEFELVSHIDERVIESFKANGQFELGRRVADLFDWQKVPFREMGIRNRSLPYGEMGRV